MISRFLLGVGLIGLMLVASFGTYTYLGGRQSKVAVAVLKPTVASPRPNAFTLSGTLYLEQSGAIYSLSGGRFHQLTGGTAEDGWTQPALTPDGKYILAVRRTYSYSDIWLLGRFGQPLQQLTSNNAPAGNPDTGARHWSFYPRLSPDQGTLFTSWDDPKFGYDVPFSIWSTPWGGGGRTLWTNSHDYTGGDMEPIPLRTGGIMYTKYNYDSDGNLMGQLWLTTRPTPQGNEGQELTYTYEDCAQPSLSPDGTQVAMICTYQKQISYLVLASWNGSSLGPRRAVIMDQLVAQPTWAPDGSGIAYLAPTSGTGAFQLWFLPKNAYNPPPPSPIPVPTPTPGGPYHGTAPSPTAGAPVAAPVVKPIQITTTAGFDATSPMSWAG
jgi:hypothetical protein